MDNIFQISKEIIKKINFKLEPGLEVSDENLKALISEEVILYSEYNFLSINEKKELISYIFNAMRRHDILQPLIDDDSISEIMINGHEEIIIEKEGKMIKTNISFESVEKLESLIQSIVGRVNRTVNSSQPICDARLLDGSRVSVVLPPISLNGPVMTIRKFSKNPLTIDNLLERGSITKDNYLYLKEAVIKRKNIFICGGTSSGKTTFLNILSEFIPKYERIITIEDSAELVLKRQSNIIKMETKNANFEGRGEISIRELIKTSLRMRPDRIIVGEVRGKEALDMLQAMNTGHDGSLCTGHANSTKDMLSRLETMVLMAMNLPLKAIRQQIVSALDIIIFLSKTSDGNRKIIEIAELTDLNNDEYSFKTVFCYS